MRAKKKETSRPVMVTTEHRGVFFGYTDDTDGDPITLKQARMCVYWSSDVKSVMGLAATGPSSSCKISPAVDEFQVRKITAVFAVSPEAVTKWEMSPWG